MKKAPLMQLDANGKPTFRYVKAAETNVAATFKRIRREQSRKELPSNVKKLVRSSGSK